MFNPSLVPLKTTLNIKGEILDLSTPLVMGVINVTPDSFHKKSRVLSVETTVQQAGIMLSEGAGIIDIGGHSTRPNAEPVSEAEEIDRVVPGIKAILAEFHETYISVDTFRSGVAREAVMAGATIVNDISGGLLDSNMFKTVADLKCPYILGHIQGSFETMMSSTQYGNLIGDIMDHFTIASRELKKLGVYDIIIDPCFGFSKDLDQNYTLLKNLAYFRNLGMPILAGISRKSMIYKFLGGTPEDALNGTTALNMIALMSGASILRVHDVKEAIETVRLYQKTWV
ncbi:MAG: dihydropteroate synthase [Cyclobacteriaceae bacterium]